MGAFGGTGNHLAMEFVDGFGESGDFNFGEVGEEDANWAGGRFGEGCGSWSWSGRSLSGLRLLIRGPLGGTFTFTFTFAFGCGSCGFFFFFGGFGESDGGRGHRHALRRFGGGQGLAFLGRALRRGFGFGFGCGGTAGGSSGGGGLVRFGGLDVHGLSV